MKALGMLPYRSTVRITFSSQAGAEIDGVVRNYDEHVLVVWANDNLTFIPWTAIGAVTLMKTESDDEAGDD